MKRVLKITVYVVLALVVVVIGVVGYVTTALPNVGDAPDITVEITPERLARGKYLANHVTLCMDCHSERDWDLPSAPPKPGTAGIGGEIFDQNMGFPGRIIARNLTPTSLGEWTDGELYRLITSGVNRDGKAIFPVMPYPNYGKMDKEDIYSIIAYIRTLKPVPSTVEATKLDFPFSLIVNTIPQKPVHEPIPPKTDKLAYGKYLVNAAACNDCHTAHLKGKPVGEPFAGGFEFKFPDGAILRSRNITPHPTSGIGHWSEEQFVARFKQYLDEDYIRTPIKGPHEITVMPWAMYAGMEEYDLKAIFAYLQSIPAVDKTIEVFTPAQ